MVYLENVFLLLKKILDGSILNFLLLAHIRFVICSARSFLHGYAQGIFKSIDGRFLVPEDLFQILYNKSYNIKQACVAVKEMATE